MGMKLFFVGRDNYHICQIFKITSRPSLLFELCKIVNIFFLKKKCNKTQFISDDLKKGTSELVTREPIFPDLEQNNNKNWETE